MFFLVIYALAGTWMCYRLLCKRNTALRETWFVLTALVIVHAITLVIQALSITSLHSGFLFEFLAFAILFLTAIVHRPGQPVKISLFTWPIALVVMICSLLFSAEHLLSESLQPYVRSIFIHISLAMLGYASFLLLTIASVLYLWQSKALKHHQNIASLTILPNMVLLEEIQSRSLYIGILVFTLAIGMGKLSPYLWEVPHKWSTKEVLSVIIWSIFFVLGIIRFFTRTQRHILAYSALVGLLLVIASFFAFKFTSFGLEVTGGA